MTDAQQIITVVKTDHAGQEIIKYQGRLIEQTSAGVVLEAKFNHDDVDLGYVTFHTGDRFVEYFYTDRWYSIFEVYAVADGSLKGWYCNFSRPAEIRDGVIRADDLALDIFVHPDGQIRVLDRDEFDALSISSDERKAVLTACDDLRKMVKEHQHPFHRL